MELLASEEIFESAGWGSNSVAQLDFASLLQDGREREILIWMDLLQEGRVVSRNLSHFARPKHLELKNPELEVKVVEQNDDLKVIVTAKRPALWVWIR